MSPGEIRLIHKRLDMIEQRQYRQTLILGILIGVSGLVSISSAIIL